jgi:prefoldin subunit 5
MSLTKTVHELATWKSSVEASISRVDQNMRSLQDEARSQQVNLSEEIRNSSLQAEDRLTASIQAILAASLPGVLSGAMAPLHAQIDSIRLTQDRLDQSCERLQALSRPDPSPSHPAN